MHTYLPESLLDGTDGECIIKVLGVTRVYGECNHITEILTSGKCRVINLGRYLIGSSLYVLRIAVGQSVLSQDGMHLCVVLTGSTQYVNDLTNRIAVRGIGPFNNLYHGFLTVTAFLEAGERNEYVTVRLVRGNQIGELTLYLKRTYKRVLGAFENLGNLTLGSGMRTLCKQHYAYAVTVHRTGRVALSHEYGITAAIGHKEVLATHTALQHTLHELAFLHEAELTVFLLEESVLNKIQYDIQTHAAHGMSLELELIIESLYAYTAVLVVTEPIRDNIRHAPAVKADTSFE